MAKGNGDVRDWDEDSYRASILQERELQSRTVFRTVFAPSPNPKPDTLVAASSDGSIAVYSLPSCIASSQRMHANNNARPISPCISMVEPQCFVQGHNGPAYDLKFYGEGEDSLLLSCGDDGRICGWRWKDILNSKLPMPTPGIDLNPVIDLLNPQHRGPWDALSPIPENNAIDVNMQDGSIYSAAGDSRAYCWDVETSKKRTVFRGHTDYLHTVVARKSSNQIITGSEDGTARIWDCRNGKCIKVIQPEEQHLKVSSLVSCVAIDTSENWLVCGTGRSLSVWSLPSCECIWNVDVGVPIQDAVFDGNQILAVGSESVLTRYNINGTIVSQIQCAAPSAFTISRHLSGVTAIGGYGGIIDVLSEFGSHLCTFSCRGM